MLAKLRLVGIILAATYVLTSLVIAYGFSMPGKTILDTSPAEYDIVYEDVAQPTQAEILDTEQSLKRLKHSQQHVNTFPVTVTSATSQILLQYPAIISL